MKMNRFLALMVCLALSLSFLGTSCTSTDSGGSGGTTFAAVKRYADQHGIEPGPVKVTYLGSSPKYHHLGVRERPQGSSTTFPGKIFKVARGGDFHPAMEHTYAGPTSRMARAF